MAKKSVFTLFSPTRKKQSQFCEFLARDFNELHEHEKTCQKIRWAKVVGSTFFHFYFWSTWPFFDKSVKTAYGQPTI